MCKDIWNLPNIGKGKEYDEGQEITQAFELEVNAP
jgi:hypothetical protein